MATATEQQLLTEIDQQIKDNNERYITPARVRAVLLKMRDYINGKTDVPQFQTHSSGAAVVVADGVSWVIVNPASTIATLDVNFPANPNDDDQLVVSFGGTMTTGTVVTVLNVVPGAGKTLLQGSHPTSLLAGEILQYRFYNTKWYRTN